ncbi:MAG: hypothetical protein ACE5EO_09845 [Candidatus Krumholzibacteriia bacterium]
MSDSERVDHDKVIAGDFGAAGAVASHLSGSGLPPEVSVSLGLLTEACGDNLVAVILFGSRLLGTSPDAHSAADLFVVVDEYEQFYRDVGRRLPARRRASIMAALNRALPPNIISVRDPGDLRAGTKCFVTSHDDLVTALSGEARDHFCRGRMMQQFQIIHSRSVEDGARLEERLLDARCLTLDWVPLYLPRTFSVLDYCRRMLEVSYAGEIRPESRSRVAEVFEAQRHYLILSYTRVLEDAVSRGRLERAGGLYRLPAPPTARTRLRWRLFFIRSKTRATLRWSKYMLTFDDWLDYIVRKVERRTGLRLELTPNERRFPILLLWPRVWHVFRAMRSIPRSRGGADDSRSKGGPV